MSRLAVGREVAKQVYIAERLAPPSSLAEVQSVTTQAYAKAQDPRFWQEAIRTGQAWKMGVYALEAYCASPLVGSLTRASHLQDRRDRRSAQPRRLLLE